MAPDPEPVVNSTGRARRPALRVAALALAASLAACGTESTTGTPPRQVVSADSEGPFPAKVADELGVPASFSNAWGMRFRLVPGGRFVDGDGKSGDPAARHETELWKAFYLAESEVTRGQWARCFGGEAAASEAGLPVEGVTYAEAERFVAWLCEQDPRWTYRLPTEAEWDRAWLSGRASAGAEAETPWGHRGMTTPPAEWCFDWYEDFPDWPVMSPRGPEVGTERVLRPGPPEHLAGRRSMAPDRRERGVGLRVAASVGYGGDDRGKYAVTFRTRGGNPTYADGDEVGGYEIRIVAIIDRLQDRQIGRHYSWRPLPGRSSPLTVRLVPGVYYAQAQRVEDGELRRGMEVKFAATKDGAVVDLPIPQPGGYYQEPE